jgi:nucleotide sugar dehydrogenase
MLSKTIGYIGLGFVGNAVKASFDKHFKSEVYDIDKAKSTTASAIELIQKCKTIFLALPTPIDNEGQCKLSIITELLDIINNHSNDTLIIVKSSVPPGTTAKFSEQFPNIKFVFNPEFLTERNSIQDFAGQDKIILGGSKKHTKLAKQIYRVVFETTPIYETDSTTAEMVKFMVNCCLAAKVSLFNEFYQITDKLNINYDEALNLTRLDKRIGESHCQVPGWDGHMGFGGSCFPANLNILINKAKELDIDPKILEACWNKNLEVRPERDWEKLEGRAFTKKKEIK